MPTLGPSVLHVLDHSWPVLSGYAIRSRNLISAQQRNGQTIRVVTGPLHELDDPQSASIVLDGVQYLRSPITSRLAYSALQKRWPFMREREVVGILRRRILAIAKLERVQVLYAHSPALCGLAALQASRQLGIPFVYEIRAFWEDAANQNGSSPLAWRSKLTHRLETYVARNANAVGAISKPMLKDLQERGISADKLFHVPNGVDTNRFVPGERDETLFRQIAFRHQPVFGFFGSLYSYEGIGWLVRAAAELRVRGNKFSILIIGKGEDRAAVDAAIREHGGADYIRIIDHVAHEEIARYYSVIDIAVYPRLSLRLTELVTPLKPLEAMALGKPVLASGVGGVRELVENDRTGLLFKAGDIPDFCRQAEKMISSPSLRKSLSEAGRDFVVRERDWRILALRYGQIYDYVLAGRPSPQLHPTAKQLS